MDKIELEKAFADNNGVLKTSQLAALKIDSTGIKRLIKNGVIEKIKTGYYRFLSDDTSEAAIVTRLFPDGVLWLNTNPMLIRKLLIKRFRHTSPIRRKI